MIHFFKDIFIGLKSYWLAILFIRQHKLYWYILIPAAFMLGIYQLGSMLQRHHFVANTDTMNGIIWYLIKMMLELTIALTLMKFSKYLVVALLSPLLSFLSQKTEKIITGNSYRFDMKQLWKDIKRGLKLLIRNLVWWYVLILIVYLTAYFATGKFVTLPTLALVFIISSFYYGFSFLDYVNERRRLNIDDSILFVRKHRGLALVIGAGYSVLILVPVDLSALFDWNRISVAPIDMLSQFFVHLFLWFCASVAPILASIASTLAMHKIVDLSSNEWLKDANV